MKILFVSPEVSPFARTGGLGEVVGSLPIALRKMGVDARIICPLHRCCKDLPLNNISGEISFPSKHSKIRSKIALFDKSESSVPVYFLINHELFDREGIYSGENTDYPDNWLRSFVLSHAATEIESLVDWKPDVLHSHDWMAAPTSAYLNAKLGKFTKKPDQGSVLTIHNLEHQGSFSKHEFDLSGLPSKYWGMNGFEHHTSLNLLKGGIQHANKLTTVSPTYAAEIKTQEFGHGLEKSLQYRGADLIGILNGINEEIWNPMTDPNIHAPIDPKNPIAGKKACKDVLLEEFKLNLNEQIPLFGVVSRLYHQKGLDLLLEIMPQLLKDQEIGCVVLGSGNEKQEKDFLKLAKQFPKALGVQIGFDDKLARRIFAGSDFFLMPSRFEPCGLAQQYAMRYGSIPIARKTGGLSDTIIQSNGKNKPANGYLFKDAKPDSLLQSINRATIDWQEPDAFLKIRKQAMNTPCSWDLAALKFKEVYKWSLKEARITDTGSRLFSN